MDPETLEKLNSMSIDELERKASELINAFGDEKITGAQFGELITIACIANRKITTQPITESEWVDIFQIMHFSPNDAAAAATIVGLVPELLASIFGAYFIDRGAPAIASWV